MKAIITSIGEPTTKLCEWALKRNGFETVLIKNDSSLADKLAVIYETANDDFLRVDADIIVNRNMTPALLKSLDTKIIWWWQFQCFDWYKQDLNHAMSFIRRPALEALRANIGRFKSDIRPETQMSRIEEFNNPRRFETYNKQIMGLHGFGIKDMKPVIKLKAQRNQSELYDFELAQRLNQL